MLDAPAYDQIEVTLIGPGFGESALIHLGNNNWVVIDSCIDSNTKKPAALAYLNSIGVNASEAVKLIIITHWHDDHVRGISDVLEACPDALVCASSVLSNEEFLATVLPFKENNLIANKSGVEELSKILNILEKRSKAGVKHKLKRAFSDREVYRLDSSESGHGVDCNIWTLSPSDKQFDKFLVELTKLVPEIKRTKYRAPSCSANHSSIVTLIKIGGQSFLFGADLEETTDVETGWSVIVSSSILANVKSMIFKVPHHGSENAHNNDVWKQMLHGSAYAILTPFNRGVKKLPAPGDVKRLSSLTSNLFSTSNIAQTKSSIKRSSAVEKSIKETIGGIRDLEPKTGIIRLRNSGSEDQESWACELFNTACKL